MAIEETKANEGEVLLQGIQGARLTSVQFVLNYLILGFDQKGALTALVWPEIVDGEQSLKFGMSGYRDHLCELIGQIVESTEINRDETIVIVFERKRQLVI